MTDQDPTHREVTDEDRAQVEEAIAQLVRDLENYEGRPLTPEEMEKFVGPIGLDAQGNKQKPLTPEEIAHKEEIKRRARGEATGETGE